MEANIKTIYILSFREIIKNPTDIERDITSTIPNFIKDCDIKVNEYIKGLDSYDIREVREVADHIIGEIYYSYTNAEPFLYHMGMAKSINKDLTPQECASVAVVNLISHYVVTQMKLV